MLTAERLREVLHYDPETGEWRWLISTNRKIRIGSKAGSIGNGYEVIVFNRKLYKSHRLAWLYMTGEWPRCHIDHADMDRSNNKWSNLRQATITQNNANRHAQKNNRAGLKGVYYHKANRKYCAQTNVGGVQRYLGIFITKEEAHNAYVNAARVEFGDYFRKE